MNEDRHANPGSPEIQMALRLSSLASAGLNFDQYCQQINDITLLQLKPIFSGVFLINETNQFARLYAGSGYAAPQLLADGFKYALFGSSTLSRCYQTGEETHSEHLDLSIRDYFKTASQEYCVPISYSGDIYGVYSAIWSQSVRPPEVVSPILQLAANLLAVQLRHEKILNENRDLRYHSERRTRLQLAIRRIAGVLNETMDRATLLSRTIEILCESFDLYYAGIFLVDEDHTWANLVAGSGNVGEIMLSQHHRLRIGGQSMVGASIQLGEVRVAMDVGEEQIHFKNPLLPHTRSELAIPLRYRKTILGAITVQSRHERAFSQDDLMTLQTLADFISLAVAKF